MSRLLIIAAAFFLMLAVPESGESKNRSLRSHLENITGKDLDKSSRRWALTRNIFSVGAGWRQMSTLQRSDAQSTLARPTQKASRRASEVGYKVKEAKPFGSQHFLVHYVTQTRHAPLRIDRNGNGVRDFVEQVASEAEFAWQKEVVERGWPAPPGDGRMGGDSRYDIYLVDLTSDGAYGATVPNRLPSSVASFMIVDNDLPEDDTGGVRTEDSLRQTMTHEFFHSIQLGMNRYLIEREGLAWLAESSATWMETTLSENDKEAKGALEDLYASLSLSVISEDAAIEGTIYGGWPYWQSIADRYGEEAVKSVFKKLQKMGRRVGGSDEFGTKTIDRILKRRGGSLTGLFTGFALDAYLAAPDHFGAEAEPEASERVVKLKRVKRFTEQSEIYRDGRFLLDKRERLEGLATHYYILRTDNPGSLGIRIDWRGPRPEIFLVVGGKRGVVYKAPAGKRSMTATVRVEPGILQRVAVVVSSRVSESSRIHGRARLRK